MVLEVAMPLAITWTSPVPTPARLSFLEPELQLAVRCSVLHEVPRGEHAGSDGCVVQSRIV